MQLIVITPGNEVNDETGIVNELFARGLQRLHLKKPSFAIEDYRNYIKRIDEKYHCRIALTADFELFNEFELGGIHLNSILRKDKTILQKVAAIPPSLISTSFHSWQEIRDNEFQYGYVFISPVFDSISKQGYKAAIDLAGAMETKQELAKHNKYCPAIIGLGGVGGPQIRTLRQNGFDGAAMIGAVWLSADPVKAFIEIAKITTSLKDG